jgi:hypothetical protein
MDFLTIICTPGYSHAGRWIGLPGKNYLPGLQPVIFLSRRRKNKQDDKDHQRLSEFISDHSMIKLLF